MSSERNPHAAKNVPLGAFIILGITYMLVMLGLAWFTAAAGANAFFIWTIATLGIVPIFYLPYLMLKGDSNYERSSMTQFMQQGINIEHGHSSGGTALIQMLIVPVCILVFLAGILILL